MTARTWHHGLVARWWAEFEVDGGKELEYFRPFVERGQPALDLGCGTGRLLIPLVREGFDVDGVDGSEDMIALCRERASREGLDPTLVVQALHDLDLPRRYATIFVCGAFGLGSTREQDVEALRRIHSQLEPGGTLVLDNEVPYAHGDLWPLWRSEGRAGLPEASEPPIRRRTGADGMEYGLRARVVSFDPVLQRLEMEIRADAVRDGRVVRDETHALTLNLYFCNELQLMLEAAGFEVAAVHGGHEARDLTPDDDFVVYVARKA